MIEYDKTIYASLVAPLAITFLTYCDCTKIMNFHTTFKFKTNICVDKYLKRC